MTDAKPVEVGEIVARLNKSCRYAGTNNEHGSPISACPGACREHAVMTDAATALLALQAEIAQIKRDAATSLSLSNSTLADVIADRDRLTQENALLTRQRDAENKVAADWKKEWREERDRADRLTQENERLAGEAAARDAKIQRLEWTIEALDKGGPPR